MHFDLFFRGCTLYTSSLVLSSGVKEVFSSDEMTIVPFGQGLCFYMYNIMKGSTKAEGLLMWAQGTTMHNNHLLLLLLGASQLQKGARWLCCSGLSLVCDNHRSRRRRCRCLAATLSPRETFGGIIRSVLLLLLDSCALLYLASH